MSTGGDACSENLTHAVEKLVMIWRFRGSSRHLVTSNHASDLTNQPGLTDVVQKFSGALARCMRGGKA